MTRPLGFFLGLAGFLLACGSRPEPTPAAAPPAPEVEYDGCWAVYLPGPVCALKRERRLSLWVKRDSDLTMQIRAGKQREAVAGEEVDTGRRFALSFPPGVSSLTVRLCHPGGTCGPPWSLTLAPPEEPGWYETLKKVKSSEDRHKLQAYLERRKGEPSKEQGLILRSLAMLAYQDGNLAKETTYLGQGIGADHAVRNLKGEVDKAALLAGLDIDQSRFSEARKLLEDLPRSPKAPALAKYQVAYYLGLLSERVGDYRSALEQLRQAAELAEHVGLPPSYQWKAEQLLAVVLQEIGRSKEAAKLFASLDAHRYPDQPCDLGSFLTNEAWSRLLAREAGEKTDDPIPLLEKARSEYDNPKNECHPEQRLNARLNLALAYLQEHRGSEARRDLDGARALAASATPQHRLWWLDLEARTVLERDPARALQLYDELAVEAERALSLEGRFRAAVGRAHAHIALRQRPTALADFAQADRLIDEQSWHVPVQEGRDTLVGQREGATREYLELLLAEEWRQRAFDLVRRDRSRLLYQLAIRDRLTRLKPAEQQAWDLALSGYRMLRDSIDQEAARQWQLPLDQIARAKESRAAQLVRAQQALDRAVAGLGDFGDQAGRSLSPPGKGEVILAYHPLPNGWVRFAAHGESIETGRFELPANLPADPELARLLLAPFQSTLKKAGSVRVLAYGPLQAVDFHALPFGGEPLFAHHLVIYSLDLPVRPSPPSPGRPVALLVSNPQSDQGYLPAARKEADEVAASIHNRGGWSLTRLDGPAARASAVSDALPRADLFHFAGHGNFAGFAGWDSALPLADGSRLTMGDILTLSRAPRWVVLSACDAGRSSKEAPGEGIGLAHAFLLAGSQGVIASTRMVDDETARHLLSALYQDWKPGTDLSRQLQRAELACRRHSPQADCTSFRLIEP